MKNLFDKPFNTSKKEEKDNINKDSKKSLENDINKLKDEKGLELIKKMLEIQQKPEKKKEDYQQISELAKKIENLFSQEFFCETLEEFEDLKNSSLYDKENKQWNKWLKKPDEFSKEETLSTDRYSNTQLLGIIVEGLFGNKEKAQKRLKKLQDTPLYNQNRKEWVSMMNDQKEVKGLSFYSDSQLLEIIANAILNDKNLSKRKLEELKESHFYNEDKKLWNYYYYPAGFSESINTDIYTHTQLLGILAEAAIGNKNEAQQKLEELKNSPLYDKEKKEWKEFVYEIDKKENGSIDLYHYSYTQLLGVLTEFILGNKNEAQQKLEELKNSPLYDKENKKWNLRINNRSNEIDEKKQQNVYYSDIQLLSIIVNAINENPDKFIKIFLGEENKK